VPWHSSHRIGGIGGKGREAKGRERPTETGTGIEADAVGEVLGHPIDGGGMARWGKSANQSRCELAKGNREASPPLRIQAAGDHQAIAASHPTGPGKGRPGSEDWQGGRGMGPAVAATFTTFAAFAAFTAFTAFAAFTVSGLGDGRTVVVMPARILMVMVMAATVFNFASATAAFTFAATAFLFHDDLRSEPQTCEEGLTSNFT